MIEPLIIKFYCHYCQGYAPVIMYPFKEKYEKAYASSEIACQRCFRTIAQVSTDLDKQGQYQFMRISSPISLGGNK